MLIQQNCVTGHLCLSIHPLDYLSVSENTYNWRSCHSLDGDYGAGNLEYMADKATVVCYLKADKNAILPHFPEHILWNNKKWRCLLFFDDYCEFVMMGRQYPFFTEAALSHITELLIKSGFGSWTNWYNDYITKFPLYKPRFFMDNVLPIGDDLISINKILVMPEFRTYFCDLTQSNIYTQPYYAYNITDCNPFTTTGWTNSNKTRIHIGQTVLCPKCEEHAMSVGDRCLCKYCLNGTTGTDTCGCCGRVITSSQYFVETMYICEQCYNSKTYECTRCHSRVFINHTKYSQRHNQYICDWCVKDIKEE